MTASLYRRVARPCAPCPKHAHAGPRDHSYPLPPPTPPPFVMDELKKPRVIEPLPAALRAANYADQNYLNGRNGGRLTARQVRQIERMARRAVPS